MLEHMTVTTRYLCTIEAEVASPLQIAQHGKLARRMVPIVGGKVSGRINGVILPGGADWQYVHEDGATDVEAHYCLELEGGDVVEVQSSGVRSGDPAVLARVFAGESVPPDAYYFRTGIKLRTSAPRYAWLTRFLAIGIAARSRDGVLIRVFEVE
ncbi:MAG TPA: DUF3237 family protein [Burkholderiales bacterium]